MIRRYSVVALVLALAVAVPCSRSAEDYNQEGPGLPALLEIGRTGKEPVSDYFDDSDTGEAGRRVRPILGMVKPEEPLGPSDKWYINSGTLFPPYKRPRGTIKVKLYTGSGANRRLVCAIGIRYFRNRTGKWQPWYRLDPDTLVIFRGNAWAPLNPVADETNLVFLTNSWAPNGEGFHHRLELQSIEGPLTIDSWIVGQGLHY